MKDVSDHKLSQLHTRGDLDKPSRPLTQVELRRRVNLIMLIDDAGGQTPMSKKLGTANTSYLSQQVSATPHRVINEKGARKLESILGLQHGWMDHPQTRIIYASKSNADTSTASELVHEEVAPERVIETPRSAIDTQRLTECIELVLQKVRHLTADKVSRIVTVLYSSQSNGDALRAMASALIELSSTN